jgi:predicted RNase H-like HicB family nuclease
MERIKFIYYQENDIWVGWLEEYPDYRSQGTTLDELKENLKDRHDWYQNPNTKISQPIPRHSEITDSLAKHIIKILGD